MTQGEGDARVAQLEAELAGLKRALDAGRVGVYDWDVGSGEITWSEELRKMVGADGGDVPRGLAVLDLIHPEDRPAAERALQRAVSTGEPIDVTFRVTGSDGATRWIASRGAVERDEEGAPRRILGVNLDVSDPYRAEQALRENQRRLQGLMEDLPGVIFYQVVTSRDMREREYVYISPNAVKVLGVSPEHLATAPGEMMGRVTYDDLAEVLAQERAAAAAMRTLEVEIAGMRRDGKLVRTRVISRPRPTPDARLIWDGVLIDITERVEAEVALRESEERFRGMADNLPILCWWADATGYIYWYNHRWYEYTGTTHGEVEGWGWQDLHHPDTLPEVVRRWSQSIASGEPFEMVFPLRGADGTFRPFLTRARPLRDANGAIVRWFGTNTDIAEQRAIEAALRHTEQELRLLNETLEQHVSHEVAKRLQAEEALRQAQKMETLGQLTGGVAHDFNNLLQIVSGNINILQRALPADAARLKRAADNAARGAERAALLTQRLLAFSRRQPLAPKPIDVNRLVVNMTELLHRSLGEVVEVQTVLGSGLWTTEADPNQLENALLNLAVNARDAMAGGGKLTIETGNATLGSDYAAANPGAAPGDYVTVLVSDTGCGMDQEMVARAIEPFFTTKEVGKGTGLGLSMVYGFVKQSGGHLKIYSEVGHGTTIGIYLPRLAGEAEAAEVDAEIAAPQRGRGETLLVCEDDEDVRAYSLQVLRELGYNVLEAHDGPSALRQLEERGAAIDLLFTDVVLPGGMTGAVLARQALLLRPELKILFTTGYARNAIVHHGRLDPGVKLITKPFSDTDLGARIRAMLDGDG